MTFKAAAIQMCSGVDPEKNAADMERLVREAASQGAVYVQTPEMTGAVQRDRPGLMAVLRDEANDVIVATAGLRSNIAVARGYVDAWLGRRRGGAGERRGGRRHRRDRPLPDLAVA